jgi:SAM-dependent methyltransferase
MSAERPSLTPEYFEVLYRGDRDPWCFETSPYEDAKYAATLAALPRPSYRSAFEIGCSIGVLTARLARRCRSLVSVDVSPLALERAVERCRDLSQVRFARMRVPEDFPGESFDLIVVSEVGYYWSWTDLARAQRAILDRLEPGGHLLLVHWTPYAKDYPLRGDEVHDAFFPLNGLVHLGGRREPQYRLDLFERSGER